MQFLTTKKRISYTASVLFILAAVAMFHHYFFQGGPKQYIGVGVMFMCFGVMFPLIAKEQSKNVSTQSK